MECHLLWRWCHYWMLIKTLDDLLIADAFWRNLLSSFAEQQIQRGDGAVRDCSSRFWNAAFEWTFPWTVCLISGLTLPPGNRLQWAGGRLSLAALLGLVSPWLSPPATPSPRPALDRDMPVVLAESCRLPGTACHTFKIKPSHVGSVQTAVCAASRPSASLLHPGVISSGFHHYFVSNYRTQAPGLIEAGSHCHSRLF